MEQAQIDSVVDRAFAYMKVALGITVNENSSEAKPAIPSKTYIEVEVEAEGARRFYAEH